MTFAPPAPCSAPVMRFSPADWALSTVPCGYDAALAAMERRVAEIAGGRARELIWLLEHPALYTAGTGAKVHDLLNAGALPVRWTGRGGKFTYHGPGQRVAYVMLDVKTRFGGDVRAFTRSLENWLITALARLGVLGFAIEGRTGVWVEAREASDVEHYAKIAAIGLRIRRGISFHGISLNVAPNLACYDGIVPCGLAGSRVTSLAALGISASLQDADAVLRAAFQETFNCDLETAAPPELGSASEES